MMFLARYALTNLKAYTHLRPRQHVQLYNTEIVYAVRKPDSASKPAWSTRLCSWLGALCWPTSSFLQGVVSASLQHCAEHHCR